MITVSFSLIHIEIMYLAGDLIAIRVSILQVRFIVCVGGVVLTSFSFLLIVGCFDATLIKLYPRVSSFSCIYALIMHFTITRLLCQPSIVMLFSFCDHRIID